MIGAELLSVLAFAYVDTAPGSFDFSTATSIIS
jgi:hypothetical protein